MHMDKDTTLRKYEELQNAYREKCRILTQTQELYDRLKRRSMLGQVQSAASYAVDHTIQASAIGNRLVDHVGNIEHQSEANMLTSHSDKHQDTMRQQYMPPPPNRGGGNTWNGYGNHEFNRRGLSPPSSES